MDEVIFKKEMNGLGIITLNRPDALNALSYHMIYSIKQKLNEWNYDDQIKLIILEGTGNRAFCAGGDIKEVYEGKQAPEQYEYIDRFLEDEYKLDQLVYDFKKPIIAIIDGIVMGGGVGLTYGANYRIATEKTRWAMPEVNIGFFPDVGAAYFLNRTPGYIGRYLALTANSVTGKDVIYINAADALIEADDLELFLNEIKRADWNKVNVKKTINNIISKYDRQNDYDEEIAQLFDEINEHFQYESIEEIIESLKKSNTLFAKETKKTILTKSPFSLKLTLKHQIESEDLSVTECLKKDTIIASHFLNHHDFLEGIRAVLIDRDQNPQYEYKTLDDVNEADIQSFFEPLKSN